MTLEQLVRDPSALWTRRDPASAPEVEALRASRPTLSVDYLAFLTLSNGGEGELGLEPGWFHLWSAREVLSLNADYQVESFLPGFFALGSNGGDEMLAFNPAGAIVTVPFIPMDAADAREIASSFTLFVRAFGRGAAAI
jgi:hypothetical protein